MDDDTNSKRPRVSGGGDDSGGEDDSKFTKGTWSKDEDDRLLDAVTKVGTDDWKAVAEMVPGRTGKQCRDRYKLKLDPTINHGPWTKAEDDRLLELAAEYGRAWTKIARNMPGRTENAVKSRISSLERSRTKDWSPDEDALLKELTRKGLDYEQMVKYFPNRSSHAIKKRGDTLHMDELTKKIKQDITPIVQQQQMQGAANATSQSSLPEPIPLSQQQAPAYPNQSGPSASQQLAGQSVMPSYGNNNGMPMMAPFHPMMMTTPKLPNMSSQSAAAQNSRLVRHSTSMTVLLQVLGSSDMPSLLQSSPMRQNTNSGSTLREQSSFSLGPPSTSLDPPQLADGETPASQFLKFLNYSDPKPSE